MRGYLLRFDSHSLPHAPHLDKHDPKEARYMGKPAYPMPTRLEYLTGVYGECCRQVTAAKILGVSAYTIAAMLKDGRLKAVCEGKKVDVHSIATYMDAPAQADFKARVTKPSYGQAKTYLVRRLTQKPP